MDRPPSPPRDNADLDTGLPIHAFALAKAPTQLPIRKAVSIQASVYDGLLPIRTMRRSKYVSDLVTISETATMAVNSKEAPIQEEEPVTGRGARLSDSRLERSHSAPPEAEATDRRATTTAASMRSRSSSAKCLSISSFSKAAADTRATSPTEEPESTTSSEPTAQPTTSPKSKATTSPKSKATTSPKSKPTIHKSNKYGRSSLHNAVRRGDKHTIKHLLEEQPELLWQPDSRGNHPLHYAVSSSVPEGATIVYMLLKAGASVNAFNDRRQTPLLIHVISTEDDNDMIPRILLYHNAKPMLKVTEDYMLAQYASFRGLHKIAASIREYM
ncbi:hypothetical protein BBJ28_00017584 [Nothophytophthora sp. Chile5]|nr:hypothetical protein BBJ28_00017584 [Nothophytophthora sp. Chile5]